MADKNKGIPYTPTVRKKKVRKELVFADQAEAQAYIEDQADDCITAEGTRYQWGVPAKERLVLFSAKHGITLTVQVLSSK